MEITGRTRINLSNIAKSIIRRDMIVFQTSQDFKEGSFINLIIQCYLNKEFQITPSYSKQKGESKVYYIKDKIIKDLQLEVEKNQTIKQFLTFSEFLKVLIESYCRIPCIEREHIILRDKILQINNAISSSKIITINTFKEGDTLRPYKIVPSNESLFSYLIAFSENKNKFEAYRVSIIKSIRETNRKFKFNSLKELAKIDDLIIEYGPTFAFEQIETIKIQFLNEEAEQSYLYSAIHRPIHTKIIDVSSKIYEFNCSLKQATYFFLRFSGNIKIISPALLKENFETLYKKGYETMKI